MRAKKQTLRTPTLREYVTSARRRRRNAYAHEDFSQVPAGWHVRTVAHPSGHQVRIAFPPGPRSTGSGQIISVLHPAIEPNPERCELSRQIRTNPVDVLTPILTGITGGATFAIGNALATKYAIKRLSNAKHPTVGQTIVYDDGRPGHREIRGEVLSVTPAGMTVQFADRADTTYIRFNDRAWMDHITMNPRARSLPPLSKKSKPWKIEERARHYDQLADLSRGGLDESYWRQKAAETRALLKKNPDETGSLNEALEGFVDFHGRTPKTVEELQEHHIRAGNYYALGSMGKLWTVPIVAGSDPETWPAPQLAWKPTEGVKCAAEPGGGMQLYFIGGNQDIDAGLARAGIEQRRWTRLGPCTAISYITEKSFDGFATSEYCHQFGEQSGELPVLWYDSTHKRIYLVGGAYRIPPYDPTLGASPGIEN
jgi:hypothetical protein